MAKGIEAALAGKTPNCDVIIGTPFIHLASVVDAIDTNKIGVAAENCADKASGAYTGEVSAQMVASTGAKYVILGHSERRAYYHETPEILKEKTILALANGLTPIFCIGEVLEEREAGKHFDVVKAQIEESLFNLSAEDFGKIILAYEPVWAIGTGKLLLQNRLKKCMRLFVKLLLINMAMKLLKTVLFFMEEVVSLRMRKNCLQIKTWTEDLSEEQLWKSIPLWALSMHFK